MMRKIFPLNLTAHADVEVTGNPVITRLESGVGNCYPGLEFDHRNLDRRFFPGLAFDFISQGDADRPNAALQGARLVGTDPADPGLRPAWDIAGATPERAEQLRGDLNKFVGGLNGTLTSDLSRGGWYISEIEQNNVAISCEPERSAGESPVPLDGMIVWRLVRSLEPGGIRIKLRFRAPAPDVSGASPPRPQQDSFTLEGWRRAFTNPISGVIDAVYQPGELTQGLCSPWQHDFRDCSCTYWASNHPDIVLTEDLPGEPTLPSGESAEPIRATTHVDWLRADRRRQATAAAQGTRRLDRQFQMDSYEINHRWEELAIVLGRKETSDFYRPPLEAIAVPFHSPDELAERLHYLATLEHAVALEYLYARYSLQRPDQLDDATRNKFPSLRQDLTFVRHEVLAIAVSEMRHLRWANEMLWKLSHEGLVSKPFEPELGVAERIPAPDRPRQLRPLTPAALNDFIAVEQPSGGIDGQYARVLSTLKLPQYGEQLGLYPMAARTIAEGMQHFSRFREIHLILRGYDQDNPPYLRPMHPATKKDAKDALTLYEQIKDLLGRGYLTGDAEEERFVAQARELMFKLDEAAEALAARMLGVPFF